MCFVYIGCLNNALTLQQAFPSILVIFFSSIITACLGFFIKDWFDIEDDHKAGKPNHSAKLSLVQRLSILFSLISDNFAIWIFTNTFNIVKLLVIVQFFLFIIYSAPPIRLKRNKIVALLLDAFYSGTVFYFIALLVTENGKVQHPGTSYIMIIIWGVSKGLRNILSHVIIDRENDMKTEIKTLATQYSIQSIFSIISRIISPLEIISFCLLIYLGLNNYTFKLIVLVPYLIYIGYTLYLFRKSFFKANTVKLYKLNDYYEIILPGLLFFILIVKIDLSYIALAALHYLLFRPWFINKITGLLKA